MNVQAPVQNKFQRLFGGAPVEAKLDGPPLSAKLAAPGLRRVSESDVAKAESLTTRAMKTAQPSATRAEKAFQVALQRTDLEVRQLLFALSEGATLSPRSPAHKHNSEALRQIVSGLKSAVMPMLTHGLESSDEAIKARIKFNLGTMSDNELGAIRAGISSLDWSDLNITTVSELVASELSRRLGMDPALETMKETVKDHLASAVDGGPVCCELVQVDLMKQAGKLVGKYHQGSEGPAAQHALVVSVLADLVQTKKIDSSMVRSYLGFLPLADAAGLAAFKPYGFGDSRRESAKGTAEADIRRMPVDRLQSHRRGCEANLRRLAKDLGDPAARIDRAVAIINVAQSLDEYELCKSGGLAADSTALDKSVLARREEIADLVRNLKDADLQLDVQSREELTQLDSALAKLGVQKFHDQITLQKVGHYELQFRKYHSDARGLLLADHLEPALKALAKASQEFKSADQILASRGGPSSQKTALTAAMQQLDRVQLRKLLSKLQETEVEQLTCALAAVGARMYGPGEAGERASDLIMLRDVTRELLEERGQAPAPHDPRTYALHEVDASVRTLIEDMYNIDLSAGIPSRKLGDAPPAGAVKPALTDSRANAGRQTIIHAAGELMGAIGMKSDSAVYSHQAFAQDVIGKCTTINTQGASLLAFGLNHGQEFAAEVNKQVSKLSNDALQRMRARLVLVPSTKPDQTEIDTAMAVWNPAHQMRETAKAGALARAEGGAAGPYLSFLRKAVADEIARRRI